jgi:hypothetical protein
MLQLRSGAFCGEHVGSTVQRDQLESAAAVGFEIGGEVDVSNAPCAQSVVDRKTPFDPSSVRQQWGVPHGTYCSAGASDCQPISLA